MKKLFLTLGLASLFMVACNNTPKEPEQNNAPATETPAPATVEEKHECPMDALKNEYAKWNELNDDAKKALNEKAVSLFNEMETKMAEMKTAGEETCKDVAAMTEEAKQKCEEAKQECEKKCAEMKAAWEGFDTKSLDEQKDLILKRLEGCGGEKECCKHEGEEGHQCQHEAK